MAHDEHDKPLTEDTQAPEEAFSGVDNPGGDSEETVASLEEQLKAAKDDQLRAAAELENVKKRLAREKEEYFKYATESLVADLLPVLDNLGLALEHGRSNEACKDFVTGVEMTEKIFMEILSRHGLEPVGQAGETFAPEWGEAVALDPDADAEPNTVTQVMQKGYRLKGRVIRPAKVMIAKPAT